MMCCLSMIFFTVRMPFSTSHHQAILLTNGTDAAMLLAQTMGYFLCFPMPRDGSVDKFDFYDYPCTKPLFPSSAHFNLKFVAYMRQLKFITNPALSLNTVYSTATGVTPLTNTTTISDLLKLAKVFFKNTLAEKILKSSCYHSSVLDS